MISWKKLFVIFSVVLYTILSILFFISLLGVPIHGQHQDKCTSRRPCVRFCPQNDSDLNEVFKTFVMSKNLNPPAKWMENDGKVVTATYSQGGEKEWLYFDFQEGTPQCAHTADYYDSSFSYIFDMSKGGKVKQGDSRVYSQDQYCYFKNDNTWVVRVCMVHDTLRNIVLATAIAISSLLIAYIFYAYLYYSELRDTYGKLLVCLLIGVVMFYISIPFTRMDNLKIRWDGFMEPTAIKVCLVGLLLIYLWYSMIWLHACWRWSNFKAIPDADLKRFVLYSVLVALLILFNIGIYHSGYLYRANVLLIVAGVILLVTFLFFIGASSYFFMQSGSIQSVEKAKFDNEKEWFWSFLAIFGILFITFVTEFFTRVYDVSFHPFPCILADIIKLFSTICIFIIFIFRENAKKLLFKNYLKVNTESTPEGA